MNKVIILITGFIWASLLLISWGGAVDVQDASLSSEQAEHAGS